MSTARASDPKSDRADLLVRARVLTLYDSQPRAAGFLVRSGRVVRPLTAQEAGIAEAREVLDLRDLWVVPGLHDAHVHLEAMGRALDQVDLRGCRSFEEVVRRVRAAAASRPPGEPLHGRGWNQEEWASRELPSHEELTRAVPDRIVVLKRVDFHATLVNGRALEAAGIGPGTADPPGGALVRDRRGVPTGVLVDAAMDLVPMGATSSAAQRERWLLAGQDACLRVGLTGVTDAGIDEGGVAAWQRMRDDGRLVLGGGAMLRADFDASGKPAPWLAERLARGPDRGGRLTFAAVKIFADGALGSRGAALLEPYCDAPGQLGLVQLDRAALEAQLAACRDAGFQACVHAIGDAANRSVLDAMERVLGDAAASSDHRWRIEHAQVVSPDDVPRFARLGVIASVQPVHATSDRCMAEARLGSARVRTAYAWRSLLASGARLALGSDAPIESEDPFAGLLAASERCDAHGQPPGGWRVEEALTREEALAGFTTWAAYAAFREHDLGSLAPGRRADFVVLREDPVTCGADVLALLRPESTWIEGVRAWPPIPP